MRSFFSILLAAVLAFLPFCTIDAAEIPVLDGIGSVDWSDLGDLKEVIYAVRQQGIDGHWYANFGYYARSPKERPFNPHTGGYLAIFNIETGQSRTIFEDWEGSVRDPCVDYDAQKVIFSYLPRGEENFHLFEINLDGTGLRQITFGPWDDIEPIYLPDGDIMFCSSRAKRWVQCWLVQVATIHRCGPNGENIRMISCNMEQDNTPWLLPNGQILYMRWEYVDRNEVSYHHLWVMNPDGTRQNVYFGNQKPGITMIDAKPIPGTDKVIALFSSGHGRRDHYGNMAVLDTKFGPDDESSVELIPNLQHTEGDPNDYADPWAFSENLYMAAHYSELRFMNKNGNFAVVHRLSETETERNYMIGEPRPIQKRTREPIIADATNPAKTTGTLLLTDIYSGRRMKDVPRGSIKELMIYETLPKPIHYSGWMEQLSHRGTFTLERFLGTVPVTPEGSAYFEIPANRSIFFIALDQEGRAVKRMHSFTSVMPGETTSCIGCHEERTETTPNQYGNELFALINKGPSQIQPIEGVPEVFDFPRDIQPILDRHCIECHNPHKREGHIDLTGNWAPLYTHSYIELSIRGMFGDNRNRMKSDFEPYTIGACASTLYKMLQEKHAGVELSDLEMNIVRCWLEAGANYAGSYAANACGQIGWYYTEVNQRDDESWPETAEMAEAVKNRCDICHAEENRRQDLTAEDIGTPYNEKMWKENFPGFIPHYLSEDEPGKFLLDGFIKRNLVFNLTTPSDSEVLLAPLAKEAGGLGICRPFENNGRIVGEEVGSPVFKDTNDADYQVILAAIERGRKYILEESNRYTMERFVPAPSYVREMIRYGILPADHDPNTPIDPFKTDEAYWESFWHKPASAETE